MIRTDEKSQAESRDYVLNKPLTRPSTTIISPIFLILGVITSGIILGLVACVVIERYVDSCVISEFWTVMGVTAFLFLCAIKPILILCIRCYQHYAPESVRRSCLCKPTCSEYAILVIKKYCLIKSLVLIYIRLFKTCTGKIYKIDFPDR